MSHWQCLSVMAGVNLAVETDCEFIPQRDPTHFVSPSCTHSNLSSYISSRLLLRALITIWCVKLNHLLARTTAGDTNNRPLIHGFLQVVHALACVWGGKTEDDSFRSRATHRNWQLQSTSLQIHIQQRNVQQIEFFEKMNINGINEVVKYVGWC